MGACASKPKVLKGEAPEAAPEVAAKEVSVVVAAKDIVEEEVIKKEDDGVVLADHDSAHKQQSLGTLFESEVKGTEQVKEETSEATQVSEPIEAKPEEVKNVVDALVTIEPEKAPEVVPTTETEASKADTTSSVEKKIEEVKPETETLPTEKKVEEVKPATETPPPEKKVEDKQNTEAAAPAEKEVEEVKESPAEKKEVEEVIKPAVLETQGEKKDEDKPAIEAPKPEAPVEKKPEEKPATKKLEEKKSGKFWWDK